MSHEVCVYKEDYYIKRYDKEDETIKISQDQYEGLEKVLLDSNMKFVKIGDRIIATSSIKEVEKVVQKTTTPILPELSEEEREKSKEALSKMRSDLLANKII